MYAINTSLSVVSMKKKFTQANLLRFTMVSKYDINECFLQPAVEALSEREAQLALRNEIENGNIDDFDNDFEWNNGKC